MAASDILGIHGHTFVNGNNRLIVGWKGASMVYNGTRWIRGATLTTNKLIYMASLVDKVFLVNGTDNNWEYNGNYWTTYENTYRSPIANFIFAHSNRLYLYGIKINNGAPSVLSWPSRVWYSDLPNNSSITWGLEYGNDLITEAGSAIVISATAKFVDRNIKIGDPFFINYSNVGNSRTKPFTVQSIDSNTQITLTENIPYKSTDDIYWVGSNWFDVGTDDGDVGNGIGLASNEIIFFKKNSVYRYNTIGPQLRQIKDAPGTPDPKFIVNWGGYCYWLHSSGIYRTSGGTFEKISAAIDELFDSSLTTIDNAFQVGAAWVNKIENTINFSIGPTTFVDRQPFNNLIINFDINMNIFSYRDYDRLIIVAGQWLRNSIAGVYIGDNSSGVYRVDTGTTFDSGSSITNDNSIPFELELYPIYPAGEETIVIFDRLRSYIKNGPDVQIFYKLIYKPRYGTENVWDSDETWHGLQGSQIGDRVDWVFPTNSRASGVKLKFVESGGDKTFLIEKFALYFSNPSNT